MIIISILFWKIKYTWSKFLKAVLFGGVSIFLKRRNWFKNVNFISHIYFPRLLFFIFLFFLFGFFFFVFYYVFWVLPRFLPTLVLSDTENLFAFCHLGRGIKWQKKLLIQEVLLAPSLDSGNLSAQTSSDKEGQHLADSVEGVHAFKKCLFNPSMPQTLCSHQGSKKQIRMCWFWRHSHLLEMKD